MTGSLRRRPGGRSARVRAAVLAAAIEELAATGYAGFSVDGAAHRAGVHKTTVYRRWGTREALALDAMLERARDQVPIPDTGSVREDLIRLATEIIASLTTPEMAAVARTLAAELPHQPDLTAVRREYWAARFLLDRQIVVRAIARGELPAGTDPDLVIEAVLGPIYLRLLVTGEPLDAEFAARVVDLALNGAHT